MINSKVSSVHYLGMRVDRSHLGQVDSKLPEEQPRDAIGIWPSEARDQIWDSNSANMQMGKKRIIQ